MALALPVIPPNTGKASATRRRTTAAAAPPKSSTAPSTARGTPTTTAGRPVGRARRPRLSPVRRNQAAPGAEGPAQLAADLPARRAQRRGHGGLQPRRQSQPLAQLRPRGRGQGPGPPLRPRKSLPDADGREPRPAANDSLAADRRHRRLETTPPRTGRHRPPGETGRHRAARRAGGRAGRPPRLGLLRRPLAGMPPAAEPLLQPALRNRLALGAGGNRLRGLGILRAGGEGLVPIGRPPGKSPRGGKLSAGALPGGEEDPRPAGLARPAGRRCWWSRGSTASARASAANQPRDAAREPGRPRARPRGDEGRVRLDPFCGRSAASAAAVDQIALPIRREVGGRPDQRRPPARSSNRPESSPSPLPPRRPIGRRSNRFPSRPTRPTPAPTTCSTA